MAKNILHTKMSNRAAPGGVVTGSLAAKVQAALYGVGIAEIFSTLQSAGAAGIGTSANIVIAGVGKYVGSYFCDLDISSESLPKDDLSQETMLKDEISGIKEFLNENKYNLLVLQPQ